MSPESWSTPNERDLAEYLFGEEDQKDEEALQRAADCVSLLVIPSAGNGFCILPEAVATGTD